jgi:ATP-dependent helicase/nuclease subunit A
LPEWAAQSAPAPQAVVTHVSPSNLGGAKAIGGSDGRDEDAAMLFGSQVHALLEHLPNIPAPQRAARAASILDGYGIAADHDALSAIMGHVEPVLGNADLSWIFEPDTLTEIGISAHLDGDDHLPIYGIIDRLCITEQDVHIIDYKTNAVVPESPDQIPQGILRQMAAYQRAVMIMYPDLAVHAGILWTANATYMPIPDMFLVHSASEHTSS